MSDQPRPRWVRPLAISGGLTVLAVAFALATGMGPHVVALAALCMLACSLTWFVVDSFAAAPPGEGVVAAPANTARVRTDRRVMHLRNGIAYGGANEAAFERLHDTLVDLVDDQLLAAHDIDRARDPAGAAAVLGPELHAFVTDPHTARRLTRPRHLERIVARIEQL